jgi:long-chain acyl-CoA synthetase
MKPWLAHYDAAVRASLAPYPEATLLDYVDTQARERGAAPAVLFKGTVVTYARLQAESDAFAQALMADGVKPGDRVAVVLPNCPQFLVAQLGVWKAGGVVVPLNPTYSERELQQALDSTRAEIVVALTPFYARVKQAQGRTPVRRVIATSIKEFLPGPLRVLFRLFKEKKDGHRIELRAGDAWMAELVRAHLGHGRPPVRVSPDDQAVILSSGGTTGTPKGVVGLHRHFVAAGLQLREWTKATLVPEADTILLPLPLFHVYGNVGVQSLAFMAPHPLGLIPNPRDLDDVMRSISRTRPALFCGVPTLYTAILNHPKVRAGLDLSFVKLCVCGAAALMAETKRAFEEKTGARIIEGYSLTEGMMACCLNPVDGPNKIGSIGMPLPDVDVRIVDGDDGARVMPIGETGELVLRAPQSMTEYWNNPLETAETLRVNAEGERWLFTGDLAYMDADGYVYLVDRKKDLIKTSGYQVWPREIEEVVSAHPAVMEVGVAGIPDAVKGEVAKAWVVLKAGRTATEDELRAYCREHLAPYKVPSAVEFRPELPKTMVGKILRRALASDAPSTAAVSGR